MKISINDFGRVRVYDDLEDYAEAKLDGSECERGALEEAAATAANNSKALGRLLDLFAERGLISSDNVTYIVEGYTSVEAVFGDPTDQENNT